MQVVVLVVLPSLLTTHCTQVRHSANTGHGHPARTEKTFDLILSSHISQSADLVLYLSHWIFD